MNQRTHAWIAIRAIKLLEDEGQVPRLIELLKPFTQEASIGAWIPDKRDAKLGGSKIQNHIFKIGVHTDQNDQRFILSRNRLLARLGNERLTSNFINNHLDVLDNNWWQVAYKADPPARKHLANRSMALSVNIIDMLILGDPVVQARVPGRVGFISKVAQTTRCSPGQAALFFFMLSHFIADTLMPCHCDKRDLSDYAKGLHKELEANWSRKIGTYFKEEKLIDQALNDNDVLEKAATVDSKFGITFNNVVPDLGTDDIWEEIVILSRASFAVASAIAPPANYPYRPAPQVLAPFDTLFKIDQAGEDLLAELDETLMHDAVLNVAMIWKHIWTKFD